MRYTSIHAAVAAIMLMLFSVAAIAAPVTDSPRGWTMDETVAALTGTTTISALLNSTQPLANMIGKPQNSVLVVRCQERGLAVYVSWPEVLNPDSTTFGGQPQTMVLWRIDQQPITANFWSRDTAGIAAGMFETKPASKLIAKLWGKKQLVVRMSGRTTQDAVFDITDLPAVATRVGAACGLSWTPAK